MQLAVFVPPRLVRVIDMNLGPIDVWVIEIPLWFANFFCDDQTQDFCNRLQGPTTCNNHLPFPTHYPSANGFSDEELQRNGCSSSCLENDHIETCPLKVGHLPTSGFSTLNYELNSNNFIQPCSMALHQQDFQSHICFPSTIFSSNLNYFENMIYENNIFDASSNVQQQPVKHEVFSDSSITCQENCEIQDPLRASIRNCLSVVKNSDDQNHYGELRSQVGISNTFCMITARNGFFFIGNEITETSAFVSNKLLEWGFSQPLGLALTSKRSLCCCFVLHSGNLCYVKFTPDGIKFSSNQIGFSYLIDEAGVRSCWESFKSLKDLMSSRDNWKTKSNGSYRNSKKTSGNNVASACPDEELGTIAEWNLRSEDGTLRIERNGLKFFSESRDLHNLYLTLNDYYLSSTIQNVQERIGYVYLKSFRHRFKQSLFFNGKYLQVKFHTQTARLDIRGLLSLRD